MKTSLKKVAVLSELKALKGSFLSPRSSKITLTSLTKEKERRKRKSDEEERGRSSVALLVFVMATLLLWFNQADLKKGYAKRISDLDLLEVPRNKR